MTWAVILWRTVLWLYMLDWGLLAWWTRARAQLHWNFFHWHQTEIFLRCTHIWRVFTGWFKGCSTLRHWPFRCSGYLWIINTRRKSSEWLLWKTSIRTHFVLFLALSTLENDPCHPSSFSVNLLIIIFIICLNTLGKSPSQLLKRNAIIKMSPSIKLRSIKCGDNRHSLLDNGTTLSDL